MRPQKIVQPAFLQLPRPIIITIITITIIAIINSKNRNSKRKLFSVVLIRSRMREHKLRFFCSEPKRHEQDLPFFGNEHHNLQFFRTVGRGNN